MCMDCGSRIAEMAGDGGRTSGVPRGGGEDDWRQIGDKGMGLQWGQTEREASRESKKGRMDNEEEERKRSREIHAG